MGFHSLQHMRIRRSTHRGRCLPALFRPQGLVTLSTVSALRIPVGFVSHRQRSVCSSEFSVPPVATPHSCSSALLFSDWPLVQSPSPGQVTTHWFAAPAMPLDLSSALRSSSSRSCRARSTPPITPLSEFSLRLENHQTKPSRQQSRHLS
jgi:hypothetical protein